MAVYTDAFSMRISNGNGNLGCSKLDVSPKCVLGTFGVRVHSKQENI